MAQAKRRKGVSKDLRTSSEGRVRRKPAGYERRETQTFKDREGAGAGKSQSAEDFKNSSGAKRDDDNLQSTGSQANRPVESLDELQQEEITGSEQDHIRAAGYSDTDEDEDEGLGDGNLGRTVRGDVDE